MNKLLLVAGFIVIAITVVSFSYLLELPESGRPEKAKQATICEFGRYSYGEGEGDFEFVLDSSGASGAEWNYVRNLTDWYYLSVSEEDAEDPNYITNQLREPIRQGMHHFLVDYSGNVTVKLARQLEENRVELVIVEANPLHTGIVRQISPLTEVVFRVEGSALKQVEASLEKLVGEETGFNYYLLEHDISWSWEDYDLALQRMGKAGKPAVIVSKIPVTGLLEQAESVRQFLFYTVGRKDVKAVVFHSLKGEGAILDRPAYQEVYRFAEAKKFSPVYYIPEECQ